MVSTILLFTYTAFFTSLVQWTNDSTRFLVHFAWGLCIFNTSLRIEIALWLAFPYLHMSNVNIHLSFHMSWLPPIERVATITVSFSLSDVIASSKSSKSSWLSTLIRFPIFSSNSVINRVLFFVYLPKSGKIVLTIFLVKSIFFTYLCFIYLIIFIVPHMITTTMIMNHIINHPTIFRYAVYHGLLKNTILSSGNTL